MQTHNEIDIEMLHLENAARKLESLRNDYEKKVDMITKEVNTIYEAIFDLQDERWRRFKS